MYYKVCFVNIEYEKYTWKNSYTYDFPCGDVSVVPIVGQSSAWAIVKEHNNFEKSSKNSDW